MGEKICLRNGRLFYFKNDGKVDIYYLYIRYHVIKTLSVLFIERIELNWKETDANGWCVSILLKNMKWYLGVLVKLHNV